SIYAAFLAHAWNDDEKRFRNFLSFERTWLEPRGSEDSHGRSVWAVAMTAVQAADPGQRRWATGLIRRIFEADDKVSSPRANAFIVLGLSAMVEAGCGANPIRGLLWAKADRLAGLFRRNANDES